MDKREQNRKEAMKMTKKQVKAMMKNLNIKLLYEDKNSLEYENSCYGNPISFVFDKGILINIYS